MPSGCVAARARPWRESVVRSAACGPSRRTVAGRPSICQAPGRTSASVGTDTGARASGGGRAGAGGGSRPCRIRTHLHAPPRLATAASACPRSPRSRSRRCSRFGESAPWCPRTSFLCGRAGDWRGRESPDEAEVLFTLLAERYERSSVMVTSLASGTGSSAIR